MIIFYHAGSPETTPNLLSWSGSLAKLAKPEDRLEVPSYLSGDIENIQMCLTEVPSSTFKLSQSLVFGDLTVLSFVGNRPAAGDQAPPPKKGGRDKGGIQR